MAASGLPLRASLPLCHPAPSTPRCGRSGSGSLTRPPARPGYPAACAAHRPVSVRPGPPEGVSRPIPVAANRVRSTCRVSCQRCSRWCLPPRFDVLPPLRVGPPGTGPCGPACAPDQVPSRFPDRSRLPTFRPTFSPRPSENVRVDPIGRCRPRGLVSNCERASTFERQCRIPIPIGQRRIA